MNIKITYNWLLEYLDTDADVYELQKYLTLCGPSIERVDEVNDPESPNGKDYVLDIEVTSNRVDMASVFGIAQEATAILPQFGKKATLKMNPLKEYTFEKMNAEPAPLKQLHIEKVDPALATRVTALVFSNVQVKPAPEFMRRRLQWCDIRSINNIVDISNYIMLSLGQPTHMFDYDLIGGQKMIIRESVKGEKLITLDDKEFTLPGGDIVIEDGEGRLIDLAGIMGGKNSAVNENTQNIVLFVQTYNKRKLRKTSMTLSQRSVAVTYFEKGLDEERVETAFVYGVELLNQYSGGVAASQLYDSYAHKYEPKKITVSLADIRNVIGVDIEAGRVTSILENLGFTVTHSNDEFHITVPSFRKYDVEIKEDIIEEVARVYGYHNLPNVIQPTVHVKQPKDIEMLFVLQQKIKYFLKHLGLHESMNYSMISKELIEKLDLNEKDHLMLANTISEEIKYMRLSLLPSLIKNMKDNQGKRDELKFFEIAKTYEPRKGDLPLEEYKLSIAVNTNFSDLKGIIEALLQELHINNYELQMSTHGLFSQNVNGEFVANSKAAGYIGQLKSMYKERMELKQSIFLAELDFHTLIENYKILSPYNDPNAFATIKLDVTIKQNEKYPFETIKQLAFETSPLLTTIEVVDKFKDQITLRFFFSSKEKNITDVEAKAELAKITSQITS